MSDGYIIRENTPCPDHPQSLTWWRAVDGYKGEHASCAICGRVMDSHIRAVVENRVAEPVTVRTFALYREHASRTDGDHPIEYYAGGLGEEAGEIWKMVKREVYHGHARHTKEQDLDEIGDVLWLLDQYAKHRGVTLAEAASFNVRKLQARYPSGFSQEASINRKDGGNE